MLLLIDSYDSFTYNLRSLVEEATGETVLVIHNDQVPQHELQSYLGLFKGVIIGPGPGSPSVDGDVGVIPWLFTQDIPLLGICLGFQSLCLSQGCAIEELGDVKHGQVYKVTHNGDPLLDGIDESFESVRYHSLHVADPLADSLEKLAYTTEPDGAEVIMAVKHKTKPWYGVQYHPESICSTFGSTLVSNFLSLAGKYNESGSRTVYEDPGSVEMLLRKINIEPLLTPKLDKPLKLHQKLIPTSSSPVTICDLLFQRGKEFMLLNSASSPGNWSIIGLPSKASLRITHSTESNDKVSLQQHGESWEEDISSIWSFLSDTMSSHIVPKTSQFPFIGGFLGLFSYEEGHFVQLEQLPRVTSSSNVPDTKLVFIEECILMNNSTGETFITSLNSAEHIQEIEELLNFPTQVTHLDEIHAEYINKPDKANYLSNFNKCQQLLRSGDSYELCLTVPTEIGIPANIHPWEIYKVLTVKNPSPYSAYFNFDDCVLLSSSPERFLSWDNETCELRPIKGTVKKTVDMTYERAKSILNTPKELGENLMIVDLIRHDLYQLLKKVSVTKLMSVEEYSTVYQLVSVIQGHFKGSAYSGIDILSQSLPPGSMTGAPKKRSVEILQELEVLRRGLYSGVCGYWSIENNADWSVIIRSMFHYKDDLKNTRDTNLWKIGAGGAITVLSDPDGEWEEMLTKLDSVLRIFQ